MKIHIVFNIKNTPTGGGNQFLKALKKYFISKKIYTDNSEKADVFLFNSHHFIPEVIRLKNKYPQKIFVHRIDGPIRLYSEMSDKRDHIINLTNKYIADATIFQSEWSRKQNLDLGLKQNKFEAVISNAPDNSIFNTNEKSEFRKFGKIKIIATSWSSWYKKGFDIYKWLDQNLDNSKYEMTFCGNSPVKFENIKHIKPLPSNLLAKQLKKHDIYITASQKDPCSNSLIEALHCGLPAIVLNDGGHNEIIKEAGEIFNKKEEIILLLDKISKNYDNYIRKITNPDIEKISENYLLFFKKLMLNNENIIRKKLKPIGNLHIKLLLFNLKIKSELQKYISINGKK